VDRTAVPSEQDRDAEIELSGVALEIRQRRKLLGLSQVQLAKESHVSRTVINKVEQGARVPSIRTYARLRASLRLCHSRVVSLDWSVESPPTSSRLR
jgi:transcriptional regulator with XRE-family HTH domain